MTTKLTMRQFKATLPRDWEVVRAGNEYQIRLTGCVGSVQFSHQNPQVVAAAAHAWESIWHSGVEFEISMERD